MKLIVGAATSAALLVGIAAQAQTKPEAKRVQALSALANCRTITDNSERLACFDRSAAELDDAEKRGDLFVTDRAEIQKTKRSLFGLNLPSFSLFKRSDGTEEPELKEIESTLAGSSYSNLKWVFVLADGSRWRQTEPHSIVDPRKGDAVVVRKASMGSYFLKINKAAGLRVERIN